MRAAHRRLEFPSVRKISGSQASGRPTASGRFQFFRLFSRRNPFRFFGTWALKPLRPNVPSDATAPALAKTGTESQPVSSLVEREPKRVWASFLRSCRRYNRLFVECFGKTGHRGVSARFHCFLSPSPQVFVGAGPACFAPIWFSTERTSNIGIGAI